MTADTVETCGIIDRLEGLAGFDRLRLGRFNDGFDGFDGFDGLDGFDGFCDCC